MGASDHTTNTKICSTCKRELPLSEFHKSSFARDGYKSQCKNCRRQYAGYQKRKLKLIPNDPEATKRCPRCNKSYPYTTRYFRRHGKTLDWCCKECARQYAKLHSYPEVAKRARAKFSQKHPEYAKERYWKDPEKARADSKRSRERHLEKRRNESREYARAHAQQARQRSSEWYYNNPERARAQWNSPKRKAYQHEYLRKYRRQPRVKEKQRAKGKQYRLTIKGKIASQAAKARRKAKKQLLLYSFSKQDWRHALVYFNGCCAVCGRPPGLWHTLAADHWIPLADIDHCPGTIPSNIVPLCHGVDGCNNSKGDRDPVEWLTARFGARKAKQILKRIEAYFASLKDDDRAND